MTAAISSTLASIAKTTLEGKNIVVRAEAIKWKSVYARAGSPA
jgi:hypothetical protein